MKPEVKNKITNIWQVLQNSEIELHAFIPKSEHQKMITEINQASKEKKETCGILIGGLIPSISRIMISKILIPPKEMINGSFTHCEIKTDYLRTLVNKNYENKQETVIGRWHLHYELEEFSNTDLEGVESFLEEKNLSWHPFHVEMLAIKTHNEIKLKTSLFIPVVITENKNKDYLKTQHIKTVDTIILPNTVFESLKPWFWDEEKVKNIFQELSNTKHFKKGNIIQTNDETIWKSMNNSTILYFPHDYSPSIMLLRNRNKKKKKQDYETITDINAFENILKRKRKYTP